MKNRNTSPTLALPVRFNTGINMLILANILVFMTYTILHLTGFYAIDKLLHTRLILSSGIHEWVPNAWSILTYQFVHINIAELLISMSMLWLFGNVLQQEIGIKKVLLLYLLCSIAAAVTFLLSHAVLPVFSGYHGMFEGSFGAVAGVMTATITLFPRHCIKTGTHHEVPLVYIYAAVVCIGMLFICKHNMAHVLAYIACLYTGFKYAESIKKQQKGSSC